MYMYSYAHTNETLGGFQLWPTFADYNALNTAVFERQ